MAQTHSDVTDTDPRSLSFDALLDAVRSAVATLERVDETLTRTRQQQRETTLAADAHRNSVIGKAKTARDAAEQEYQRAVQAAATAHQVALDRIKEVIEAAVVAHREASEVAGAFLRELRSREEQIAKVARHA